MSQRNVTDQDGKSKTASAVDRDSYPEQDQVQAEAIPRAPTEERIRARAHEIWVQKGQPDGTADQDWRQAQEELMADTEDRQDLRAMREETGSVQR